MSAWPSSIPPAAATTSRRPAIRRRRSRFRGCACPRASFPCWACKPLLGRTFLPEEETLGKDHEVVLSYGLWKTRYGGDPSLVGKTIRIDGADFTVIGVMPRDFEWQFWSGPRQLWVPVGYTKTDFGRGDNSFISIARLKPGVSVAQARAEMEAVGQQRRSGSIPRKTRTWARPCRP